MKSENFKKTVIINRAVPGSGKTTISRCISQALADAGLHFGTHSTDDYFMDGMRYRFDIRKLGAYHRRNQECFCADLARGTDVVICDNTNLIPWQTEPYTESARKYGYQIIFLNFQPRELWKHVQSQIVTPEKPDAHEVPEETLLAFIRDYYLYDNLFDGKTEVVSGKQYDYYWNDKLCVPQKTGCPAKHFDFDQIIRIAPDEYHQLKSTIGVRLLNMMVV